MTATAINSPIHKALDFWDSPIGKKTVMAVTGMILFGFVLVHMAGNLQVFLGREKFDAYGRLLRVEPALLWFARGVLLLAVILHIVASIQLTALNQKSRPIGYKKSTRALLYFQMVTGESSVGDRQIVFRMSSDRKSVLIDEGGLVLAFLVGIF